jgi:glutaredoxin/cytochrome c biogenesis protein CcdA
MNHMKNIMSGVLLALMLVSTFYATPLIAQDELIVSGSAVSEPVVYMFGRDDCGFCKAQSAWLNEEGISYEYLNILTDDQANQWYNQVAEKHEVSKVTPITVIGERVIVGFNAPETTGSSIKAAIETARTSDITDIEDHIANAPKQSVTVGGGCSELSCDIGAEAGFQFDLPLIGIVDLKSFSLFSLSLVLGVIDGFNPCAMWVLITFLTLLSQAGSKKKMVLLAGIFILAQGIMYNLILNVWYKTWNFVALDQYVTPLVGFLALGGGIFFLWRWNKNKDAALVCDITDIETQSKTMNKFQEIVNKPVTIMSVLAILLIAFSVNVIEFACSIGIPQAYTKILDLNLLTFFERQWYILVFTLGYMVDDVVVFALAIWGYSKLQSHGGKYAQLSLLIGGVLMLALGLILVLNPSLLVL